MGYYFLYRFITSTFHQQCNRIEYLPFFDQGSKQRCRSDKRKEIQGEIMITIPKDFHNNSMVDKKFKELIVFINQLEKELEYPNCEGYSDQKRVLSLAQNELILLGFL